jgi:hypothetical protein
MLWQMKDRMILAVSVRALFELIFVAIAILILFRFDSPFESMAISLLILILNNVLGIVNSSDLAHEELLLRLSDKEGKKDTQKQAESQLINTASHFVDLTAVIIVNLVALVAIGRVLIGKYL